MEKPDISHDDILDVCELTRKLESSICDILAENERTLCMSALMSASINCMLAQCETFNEALIFRNVFMKIFDSSVRAIKIKDS